MGKFINKSNQLILQLLLLFTKRYLLLKEKFFKYLKYKSLIIIINFSQNLGLLAMYDIKNC